MTLVTIEPIIIYYIQMYMYISYDAYIHMKSCCGAGPGRPAKELQKQRKSLVVIKGQLRVHLARVVLLQLPHVSAVRIQATYRGWKGRQAPPPAKQEPLNAFRDRVLPSG